MTIRLKIPIKQAEPGTPGWLRHPLEKVALATVVLALCAAVGTFTYYYIKYEKIVDRRMRGPIFANAAKIYALPKLVHTGDKVTVSEIAAQLRRAGYTESGDSPMGTFKLVKSGMEIRTGPASFHIA